MSDDVAVRVVAARGVLQTARDNLDAVVAGLPDGATDNAMATPALLQLVLSVVRARRNLEGLESLLTRTPAT